MAIDRSGKWWKGSELADIAQYLDELEPGGYEINRVVEAHCQCGSTLFRLEFDDENELARLTCDACGLQSFVADSADHWEDAEPKKHKCLCRGNVFELALGLSIRDNEWVRWGSLGARIAKCGILGSPLDWKSDLDLTDPDCHAHRQLFGFRLVR